MLMVLQEEAQDCSCTQAVSVQASARREGVGAHKCETQPRAPDATTVCREQQGLLQDVLCASRSEAACRGGQQGRCWRCSSGSSNGGAGAGCCAQGVCRWRVTLHLLLFL